MGLATVAHAAGAMRVATDATFPPLEFVQNGKRTGFDIDLIEAMAKVMGRQVEWVDIDFKGLIPGLLANRFDVAASGIYMTDDRRKVVAFTDAYYQGGLAVLVKKDNKAINRPEDLAGKKVSVQVGTKSVTFLKETYPTVQRVEVEKNQEMFDLLNIGRVDAVVTGRSRQPAPSATVPMTTPTNAPTMKPEPDDDRGRPALASVAAFCCESTIFFFGRGVGTCSSGIRTCGALTSGILIAAWQWGHRSISPRDSSSISSSLPQA